jgi:hypothetical protein
VRESQRGRVPLAIVHFGCFFDSDDVHCDVIVYISILRPDD